MINDMDMYFNEIHDARVELADLMKEKINLRAEAWKEAEGTVDAKKDYVRSMVSDIQCKIDKLESDVEYYYNQVKLLTYKLEHGDE